MNFNRVNELLDLPREVGTDIPKITMVGFDELIIENYKGRPKVEADEKSRRKKTGHGTTKTYWPAQQSASLSSLIVWWAEATCGNYTRNDVKP